MTSSLEEYLKMVGLLSDKGDVRITDIAYGLGVSKPSVVTALKTLGAKGMVEHERYRTVNLTKEGKRRADEICRRNRLITAFLQDMLGVNAETAERDACKLEHILSDETIEKMQVLRKSQET
jgi:DtxR family Mn-dependent transcriptional regulator